MNAVILAVGSELLTPGRRDTNAEWLALRLLDCGLETSWRAAVGDDVPRISGLLRAAARDADAILITGGLGPTEDDRTREAIATAFDVKLTRDAEMARRIASLFSARGRVAGPRQFLQADLPEGAAWVDNPLGSAPGLTLERDTCLVVALPGVPAEMKAMFDASVAPLLAARAGRSLARTTLRIAGRPESYVDDLVRDLYGAEGTETTILASSGSVELLSIARDADPVQARAKLARLSQAMRARLGVDVYAEGDDSLAAVVGRALMARGATVAVAESCTGGLLGATITDVPGSLAWFLGGIVCYANELKTSLVGVPPGSLAAHGAVSEPVARALAEGARRVCGATFGLGITGVAGPDGGTPEKPVGTVHIALADGASGRAVQLDWPGDRELIRRRAVTVALDTLRRRLLV